jgi:hypothetical protein
VVALFFLIQKFHSQEYEYPKLYQQGRRCAVSITFRKSDDKKKAALGFVYQS